MTIESAFALVPWASDTARQRLEVLARDHGETDGGAVFASVDRVQHLLRERSGPTCLHLYAGTNVISPRVEAAHDPLLSTRPALGWPGEKLQPALEQIEALEVIATQQLRRAFHARFAEPRYLTATLANLGAYTAFAEPGDTIAILAPNDGSHVSHHATGTAGVRGLRTHYLPYDTRRLDIDTGRLPEFIDRVNPKIILVGGSVIQFPTRLAPLREAADRCGARLVFDASHVAGLIAAGVFPNPLDAGVDLMTFSTYKTLAGPAGGAAVTNDAEIAERVSHAIYPVLSSNYDPARLGPLAVAAAEAIEQDPGWAGLTVALAKDLAARLAFHGFDVQGADLGYTQTHQVVVDVSSYGGGSAVMRRLEQQGIYVGSCRLSGQDLTAPPAGIRIGTQEIVRRGATLEHAADIAATIADGARSDPQVPRHRVEAVRHSFGPDIWGRSPSAKVSQRQ